MLEINFTQNEHFIFVSDVHLAPFDFETQNKFLTKLNQLCDEYSIEKIFFLGDIFEWCYSWNSLWLKVYAPIVDWLHGLSKKKIDLFWIDGNHDVFLSDWEKYFLRLKASPDYIFLKGDKKILLCHGDLCNQSDIAYLILRKFLRLPSFKFLYKLLSEQYSLKIALQIAHKSHQKNWHTWNQAQLNQWKLNIQEWYTEFIKLQATPDFIIMGHFHQSNQSSLINLTAGQPNTHVYHLPYFPESGQFLVYHKGDFFYQ